MVQDSKNEGIVFGAGESQSLTLLTQPSPYLHMAPQPGPPSARHPQPVWLFWVRMGLCHLVLQKWCLC